MEFDSKKERKNEKEKTKTKTKNKNKKEKEGKAKSVITKCGVYGCELPVKARLWRVQRQENVQYQFQ